MPSKLTGGRGVSSGGVMRVSTSPAWLHESTHSQHSVNIEIRVPDISNFLQSCTVSEERSSDGRVGHRAENAWLFLGVLIRRLRSGFFSQAAAIRPAWHAP